MPADAALPLFGFPLMLARVAGIFTFIPLPGVRSAGDPIRIVFALVTAIALFPRWPAVDLVSAGAARLAVWAAAEAALGIALGLIVAMVLETFSLAAQLFGLQAGYAYASTVDPNTQADSGILIVLAQLAAGLLFFALGLDREVFRLLSLTFDRLPPGEFAPSRHWADALIRLGNGMFPVALRLAFPVVALLLMADLALALLGRLNSQLQLLSLAFPLKMLAALVVLAWGAGLWPRLLRQWSEASWRTALQLLGG
jgi:flagellar biosynthetic protein FliR